MGCWPATGQSDFSNSLLRPELFRQDSRAGLTHYQHQGLRLMIHFRQSLRILPLSVTLDLHNLA